MHPGNMLVFMLLGIGTRVDRDEWGELRVLPRESRMADKEPRLEQPMLREEQMEKAKSDQSCGELNINKSKAKPRPQIVHDLYQL